jgi:hypothetical protein
MTQVMIDPRITGYPTHPQQSNGHLQPTQQTAPTSAPANRDPSPNRNSSQMSNGSQSQAPSGNIPSISSIVHNHTPTPTPAPPADDTRSTSSLSIGAGSRQGSASPKDGKGKGSGTGGPQDIPHTKLGPSFGGEDVRALRVLDRKFYI